MKYLYGEFTENQISCIARSMHNDIHKLLLYKDKNFGDIIFDNDEDFFNYYKNLLFKFGGLNDLLSNPSNFVYLMATLQAGYSNVKSSHFNYKRFRKAILDCHGYIKSMFESDESEVFKDAEL